MQCFQFPCQCDSRSSYPFHQTDVIWLPCMDIWMNNVTIRRSSYSCLKIRPLMLQSTQQSNPWYTSLYSVCPRGLALYHPPLSLPEDHYTTIQSVFSTPWEQITDLQIESSHIQALLVTEKLFSSFAMLLVWVS